jgi:hypothetical protein
VTELTPAQCNRLNELEHIIEVKLQTFVEVGLALTEIRDTRLYQQTYGSFEQYLIERWGMNRAHGYRLINAARVVEIVSPMGDIPNERQARALVPLLDAPKELKESWKEAMANNDGKPTAATVAQAAKRHIVSDEEKARILALRADGMILRDIADIIGVAPNTISRVINAALPAGKKPKRKAVASAQTLTLGKLHTAAREWGKMHEEEYIPANEVARRIRVIAEVSDILTQKRRRYYELQRGQTSDENA